MVPLDHENDLAVLLERLGAQLHAANRMGREFEDAMGDLIAKCAAAARPAAAFQRLDILVQRIENLALYAEALAHAVPPDVVVDPRMAAGRVKLRALSTALIAKRAEDSGQEGELHLF